MWGRKKEKYQVHKPSCRITVKYDVGFNNAFYIRGEGAGLSWNKGKMLRNVGRDEWVWETEMPFTECEFKILLNDQVFEDGPNHRLGHGKNMHFTPHFRQTA